MRQYRQLFGHHSKVCYPETVARGRAQCAGRRASRSASRILRALTLFFGLGLLVGVAVCPTSTRAQAEGDIDLIRSQNAAPPNVMILFDTSEQMRHVSFHDDFDATVFYADDGVAKSCNLTVPAIPSSGGFCPDNPGGGTCPNNSGTARGKGYLLGGIDSFSCKKSDFPAGCTGWTLGNCTLGGSSITFEIPNYGPAPYTTRWSENYLGFLVEYLADNGALPANLPTTTRIEDARDVIKTLVNTINAPRPGGFADVVRFGLARYSSEFSDPTLNPQPPVPDPDTDVFATGSNEGNGGYVVVPIGPGNNKAISDALDTFDPVDFNPVGTALLDIGRYYVGKYANNFDGSVGLGAFPQYLRSTTDGSYDPVGAPPSPITASADCQKNFVIVMTSGAPDKGDKEQNDTPDNLGGGAGGLYTDTFGSDFANDGGGTAADPQFITDVAGYLYISDFDDPNTPVQDLVADDDLPGDQNVITYTVGFTVDSPTLERAAQKGGGLYFTSSSTADLIDDLRLAIDDIILRSATFTSATVPTSRQTFADAFFVTFLEPRPEGTLWVGHLQAFRLDENFNILNKFEDPALDANGAFIEPRLPFWDTQDALHSLPAGKTRNLLTTKSNATIPFTTATIAKGDLDVDVSDLGDYPYNPDLPAVTDPEVLADDIVSFVHGEDSFDADRNGNDTELREAVLGDIFHSNPLAISAPPPFLEGEQGYSSFSSTYAERPRILYTGANDGMLHGVYAGKFETGDNPKTPAVKEQVYYTLNETGREGEELFGYIPGFLLTKIKQLPQRISKPFYVDGTPSAGDAWLPAETDDATTPDKEPEEWTTVLMTGMRNGGDGYLALDITNPDAGTGDAHGPYPKLMWEFTDSDLGRTWSEPVITRVKIKDQFQGDFCGAANNEGQDTNFTNGNCREQWVAIFGGGYREAGNPNDATYLTKGTTGFSSESKSIYIVNLSDGSILAKAVYSSDSSNPLNEMVYSIPSQPAVIDSDFDGFADLVYVGDLGGQMWKWDLSEIGKPNSTTGLVSLDDWPIDRIFFAPQASNGHYRNIFFPPSVSLVGNGSLRLAFGTGERTDLEYATTSGIDENRFYVLQDDNPIGPDRFKGAPFQEGNLTDITSEQTDTDLTDQGFFLVAGDNEKFVTDHLTFAGQVITASYVPDLGAAVVLCQPRGDATLYVFAVADGEGFYDYDPAQPNESRRLSLGGGLPTSPAIVSSNLAGTRVVVQTSDGRVLAEEGPAAGIDGAQVIFWREVF